MKSLPITRGGMCCLLGAVVVALVCWSRTGLCAVQEPTVAAGQGAGGSPEAKKPFLYGLESCRECHQKRESLDLAKGKYPAVCRGKEMKIWLPKDRHHIAYKVLEGDLAREMEKNLKKSLKTGKVMEEPACLRCHSAYVGPGSQDDVKVSKLFDKKEGVSCAVCHGLDRGWLKEHGSDNDLERDDWRKLPRTTKQDKWGMTDLWDPVVRTRLCASCHIGHIGNKGEEKFVTHEMYAAGHPPLPSFEIVAFSNQMPRHWETLAEKKKNRDKKILEDLNLNESDAELEQTHLLAIGSLVAFQESLKLLYDLAEQSEKAAESKKEDVWPEFAMYDCYACHHDLGSKSWRQKRGYAGKPGRPALQYWSDALVQLGAVHSANGLSQAEKSLGAFKAELGSLQQVFDKQPFGAPAAVKERAGILIKWAQGQLDQLQKNIKAKEYAKKAPALELLKTLARLRSEKIPDFHFARQLSWAFAALYPEALPERGENALDGTDAWKNLDTLLNLTWPQDNKVWVKDIMLKTLKCLNDYDPDDYFARLDALFKIAGVEVDAKQK